MLSSYVFDFLPSTPDPAGTQLLCLQKSQKALFGLSSFPSSRPASCSLHFCFSCGSTSGSGSILPPFISGTSISDMLCARREYNYWEARMCPILLSFAIFFNGVSGINSVMLKGNHILLAFQQSNIFFSIEWLLLTQPILMR